MSKAEKENKPGGFGGTVRGGGEFLPEKAGVLLLAVVFIVLTVIITSIPHGVGQKEGHMKDEEGYFAWADLYDQGIYSIPLDEASGRYEHVASFSIDPAVQDFSIATSVADLDGGGSANDVSVTVTRIDGTPVQGALVRIFLGKDRMSSANTDQEGQAVMNDVARGVHPLDVIIERDEASPPVVIKGSIESAGATGIYGIRLLVNHTVLTDNYLEDLRVSLEDARGLPLSANISFNGAPLGEVPQFGALSLINVSGKYGILNVHSRNGTPLSGVTVFLEGERSGVTGATGNVLLSVMENVSLDVTVLDTLDRPVEGAVVTLDGGQLVLGETSSSGGLSTSGAIRLRVGDHVLRAQKTAEGYDIPLASGIGEVEGEIHYVNHWPPGPSVLIAWLMALGLENFFGVLIMAPLIVGTYGLGRRFFGHHVAFFGTLFTMLNGVVVLLYYGQWMGDLASTSFAVMGLWLFTEGAERAFGATTMPGEPRMEGDTTGLTVMGHVSVVLLCAAGGLAFAAGVAMRYSSAVLCIAPVVYLVWRAYPWRFARTFGERAKKMLSRRVLAPSLESLVPLVIGMMVIGALIASYNTYYFGGPFNSGYQSQRTLMVTSEDATGNTSLTVYEPSEDFFSAYFGYNSNSIGNMPQVFNFLLVLIPVFFLGLPMLWLGRRKPVIAASFAWMASVLIIYLGQSWVLNRVVEDIRYYLPLVPMGALLTGHLFKSVMESGLAKGWSVSRRKVFGAVFIALLVSSGLLTGADLVGQAASFKGGPRPPSLQEPVAATIPELLDSPQDYIGRPVTVVNAFYTGNQPVPKVIVIGDNVEGNRRVTADLTDLDRLPELRDWREGYQVEVTGIFVPDRHRPDQFVVIVKWPEDIRFFPRQGGSRGMTSMSLGQEPPPLGGGMPLGKLALSPPQEAARVLSVAMLVILYATGIAAIRHTRRGEGEVEDLPRFDVVGVGQAPGPPSGEGGPVMGGAEPGRETESEPGMGPSGGK